MSIGEVEHLEWQISNRARFPDDPIDLTVAQAQAVLEELRRVELERDEARRDLDWALSRQI